MIARSSSDAYGLSTPISAQEEERIGLPDALTGIGPNDVLCGRGKESFNHVGNKRFRETITNSLQDYSNAETRVEKSLVVLSIFDSIRTRGGRFLKRDDAEGRWYELSDQQTKDKIAHAVRDAVNSTEARRAGKKLPPKKAKMQQHAAAGAYDYKTGSSPIMEEDTSETPSYAASTSYLPNTQGIMGKVDDSFHSRGGSAYYQNNLEAAGGSDFRSPRHSQTIVNPGFFPARPTPHPFSGAGTEQYYGSSSVFPGVGPSSVFPAGSVADGTSAIYAENDLLGPIYGSLRSSAPSNLPASNQGLQLAQSTSIPFPQDNPLFLGHQQQYAVSTTSSVLTSAQVAEQPQPDPFLDRINEVLGPLNSYDSHDSTTRRRFSGQPNIETSAAAEQQDDGAAYGGSGNRRIG
ncbi:hypothetical protein ACA910_022565 [Epithemia clementina (nom. ined.)]